MTMPPGDPAVLLARLCDGLHVEHGDAVGYPAGHVQPEAVVPTARLLALTAGRLRYRVDGSAVELRAGDRLLVFAGARRGWRALDPARLAWVEFTFAGMRALPHSHLRVHDGAEAAAAEIARLLTEARGPRAIDRASAEHGVRALLARFLAGLVDDDCAAQRRRPSPGAAAAAAWLDANHARADALAMAQRVAGLSANRFRLALRAATGLAPRDYLLHARLRAARTLLQRGATVAAAAAAVGFADAFYFSRAYRRRWGRTPTSDRGLGP